MNPALPGGATDGPDSTLTSSSWAVQTRLAYTFVPYGRLQQGTADAPNPGELAIDVHLGSIQLTATAPTGTSLDVQLPFGSLRTTTFMAARTDTGVGDLELRVRQRATRWLSLPQLGAALGVALPSGGYIERSGAANLPPEAVTLTLGRGVSWGIVELEAQIARARGSVFAQLSGRVPLGRTRDDFAWGSELRASLGGAVQLGGRWSFLASTDVQWRGNATEPDPFTMGGRVESANAGGVWWSASPAARCALGGGLAVTAGARFAIAADVVGNQLVPQAGGFVALSYAHAGSRAASAGPIAAPGVRTYSARLTVVDYWATWCEPCTRIHAMLDAAAARWPDVEIVRVDATAWPDPAAPSLPEGVAGLPAIEVLDASGRRIHLLVGADALRVVEIVDNLRKGTAP